MKTRFLGQILTVVILTLSAQNISAQTTPAGTAEPYRQALELTREKKFDQALVLLMPIAEKGHSGALSLLGLMYRNGDGVPKDADKAREWFEKSAQAGSPLGLYQMGIMYLSGDGAPKDATKGREYLEKAAEKGNESAKRRLAALDAPAAAPVAASTPQAASVPTAVPTPKPALPKPSFNMDDIIAAKAVKQDLDFDVRKLEETIKNLQQKIYAGYGSAAEKQGRVDAKKELAQLTRDIVQRMQPSKRYGDFNQSTQGKLTLRFMGMNTVGSLCFLDFRLMNKLGFDLNRNTLYASIQAGNSNNRLFPANENYSNDDVGSIINFRVLKNNEYADGTVLLNYEGICRYDPNYSYPFARVNSISFGDEEQAIKDGIKTPSQFAMTGGPDSFDFKFNTANSLFEKVRMEDPAYRALKAKKQSCYSACQSRLESCVIQYKSAANQICGMPNATCLSGCDNIK